MSDDTQLLHELFLSSRERVEDDIKIRIYTLDKLINCFFNKNNREKSLSKVYEIITNCEKLFLIIYENKYDLNLEKSLSSYTSNFLEIIKNFQKFPQCEELAYFSKSYLLNINKKYSFNTPIFFMNFGLHLGIATEVALKLVNYLENFLIQSSKEGIDTKKDYPALNVLIKCLGNFLYFINFFHTRFIEIKPKENSNDDSNK